MNFPNFKLTSEEYFNKVRLEELGLREFGVDTDKSELDEFEKLCQWFDDTFKGVK